MLLSKMFPELDRLPTRDARRAAVARAKREVGKQWLYWMAAVGIIAADVCIVLSLPALGVPIASSGTVRGLLMAASMLGLWLLGWSFRKTIRRALWRILVEHGIPCCTACGYDLTGNTSGRCPECGWVI